MFHVKDRASSVDVLTAVPLSSALTWRLGPATLKP
jgi:hypothetical protein